MPGNVVIRRCKVASSGQDWVSYVRPTVAQLACCPPEPVQAHGALVVAQTTAEPEENALIAAEHAATDTFGWPLNRANTAARAPSVAADANCCCIQNNTAKLSTPQMNISSMIKVNENSSAAMPR